MRLFPRISLILPLLLVSTLNMAGPPPGSPGTATPQPYGQPQARPLGGSNRNPPLLNSPAQHRPLSQPRPVPRDQPLPQLERPRTSSPAPARPAGQR
ncbi:conserved exported hypothetical protein [Pseudomonas sp. 8AS]|uniref:hypothetical protein n=1 Tax=Pseudomonas sp. 8AS TaxID=2653163 RepID=UPI0012EF2622|nr:hypothetical protein [Pseudomonas sp. 8AS]VXB68443.1 conserved exported hypothetical protein [Pseudomonas sp. 8AS]